MRRRGFTLVEAAVAIAVMAILAGAMAPLARRTLERRREAATRRSLRLAFEALFGTRERRVPNLRADCGFTPARSARALPFLVRRPQEFAPSGAGDASFRWGWNGPYWNGPTREDVPVDAWGNPIQLVVDHGAVQVVSTGPDRGRSDEDLRYPQVPVPLASLDACVILQVTLTRPDMDARVRVRFPREGAGHQLQQTTAQQVLRREGLQSFTFYLPAGGMELVAEHADPKAYPAPPPIHLDLLPGEIREVRMVL